MKILIIGGSGIISTDVVKKCKDAGHELTVINRGKRNKQRIDDINYVIADVKADERGNIQKKLGNEPYDAVIDFLSYNLEQLKKSSGLVKCRQYIFISSSSIYEENESHIYSEKSKKGNDGWDYCKNKYQCECALPHIAEENGFKYTIVRPYVTYSDRRFPYQISPVDYYTVVYRIEHELPLPIINRESLTTVTSSEDFAVGIVGLIGNDAAFDNDFHITSDVNVKWTDISDLMAEKFSVKCHYVDLNSKFLSNYSNTIIEIPELLLDKSREMRFDNTKIKQAVPNFKADHRIEESVDDIYGYFIDESNRRFNYLWTGCLDRLIFQASGLRVKAKSYLFGSGKDKVLYSIGRNSLLCSCFIHARNLRNKIKNKGNW